MNTKLIGFPFAGGEGGRVATDYDLTEVIGKCPLPSSVLTWHTMDAITDITGAGAGKGAGKTLRPACAVGAGTDSDVARAQREEENEARSPWVAELIAGEHSTGRALMLLAGGREFLAGQQVRMTSSGMAARAARYLKARRGRTPSDTSLQDAAATAAMTLVIQAYVWEYVLGIDGICPQIASVKTT